MSINSFVNVATILAAFTHKKSESKGDGPIVRQKKKEKFLSRPWWEYSGFVTIDK